MENVTHKEPREKPRNRHKSIVCTAGEIGRNSRHSRSRLLCITAGIWRAISAAAARAMPARLLGPGSLDRPEGNTSHVFAPTYPDRQNYLVEGCVDPAQQDPQ